MFLMLLIYIFVFGAASKPSPCCLPKQWSAILPTVVDKANHTSGISTMASGNIQVHFDSVSQFEVTHEFLKVTPPIPAVQKEVKIIKDYIEGVQWRILMDQKKCFASKLSDKMSHCLTGNVVYQGTSTFKKIPSQNWLQTFPKENKTVKLTVTSQCLPTMKITTTAGNDLYSVAISTFEGFVVGPPDPDIFIPPPYCPLTP